MIRLVLSLFFLGLSIGPAAQVAPGESFRDTCKPILPTGLVDTGTWDYLAPEATGVWSHRDYLRYEATVTVEEVAASGEAWVPTEQRVSASNAEGSGGNISYSLWDTASQEWAPANRRRSVALDGDQTTEILFEYRHDSGSFKPSSIYLYGYDTNGFLVSEEGQGWYLTTSTTTERRPSRRNLFERDASGTYTSKRFDRFADGSWTGDQRTETEFDADLNRTTCNLYAVGQNDYLFVRYETEYDDRGNRTSVVRSGGTQAAPSLTRTDSTAYAYSSDDRLLSITRYGQSGGQWETTPELYEFTRDATDRIEAITQYQIRVNGTRLGLSRQLYTYHDNGLIREAIEETLPFGSQTWSPQKRMRYDSAVLVGTSDEVPIAALGIFLSFGPNPVSDVAEAELSVSPLERILEVYDARGRRVFREVVAPGVSRLSIPVRELAPGTYVARAVSGEGSASHTFTVAR